MSNTKSATGGMPREKPKLVTVTVIIGPDCGSELFAHRLLQFIDRKSGGVDHHVGPAA